MADRLKFAIIITVLAVLIFYLLALFYPAYWNWSVYSLATHNYIQIVLLAIVLLLLFTPDLAGSILRALTGFGALLANLPKAVKLILWIAVPLVLLYVLRVQAHIYGDAQNLIGSMVDGKITSPLYNRIGMLLQLLSNLLGISGGTRANAETYLAIVSIIAGTFFIYFTWKTVTQFIKIKNLQTAVFLVIVSSGFILIFAGYIETYAIVCAWLACYTYNLLLYDDKKISTLRFAIIFLIGAIWHVLFLAFLPSFVWMLNKRYRLISNWLVYAFMIVFIACMYIAGQYIKIGSFKLTVPLISNEFTSYTIISGAHLIDFLNELLIIGPILSIIGLIILFNSFRENKSNLFIWLTAPALALAFMLDPLLGAVRDWDLLAVFAFPLIILAVNALVTKDSGKLGYLLVPILMLNIVATGSSITVNKSKAMAVDRVVRVALEDPHYQPDYYYGSRTQEFSVILSNIFDRHDLALSFLERKIYPGNVDLLAMAYYHFNQENYEKACEYYDQVYDKVEMNKMYRFAYGKSLILCRRPAEALPVLYSALEDTAFHKLYYHLGLAHILNMKVDSGVKYFELGLMDYPDSLGAMQKYSLFLEAFGLPGLAAYYETRLFRADVDLADSLDLLNHIIDNFEQIGLTDSADHYRQLLK